MGDLIAQVVGFSKKLLQDQLMFSKEVEAVVLEVKVIYGLGTTVDIILRNGILNEGDSLILNGTEGPFVTQARALLMPQPLKELRVKNSYINHKTIIASQGVKICGKDLEKAIAGTPVLVAKKPDEIDVLKVIISVVRYLSLVLFVYIYRMRQHVLYLVSLELSN